MVPHPLLEDLALLADGRAGRELARSLESHLSVCRSCHAAWADAVRTRAELRSHPENFQLDEGTLQRASRLHLNPKRRSAVGLSRRTWLVLAPAATVGLAALIIMRLVPSGGSPEAVVPEPIRTSIASASAVGMILPGGEGAAGDATPQHRGTSSSDEQAIALLTDMAQTNLLATGPVDAVVWLLSGYVAEGQLDIAGALTRQALVRFPRDERIRTIEAVIRYRAGNAEQAEILLRHLLRSNPQNHSVSLNLGILLAEKGETIEAQELLRQVADEAADSPLGARAQRELDRTAGVDD